MLSWALWNGRAGVGLALGVRACLLVLFLAVVRRLGGAPAPGVGARDPDGLHDVLQREAAAEAGGAAARVAVSAGELGAATRAYRMPNCTLRMSTGRMIMLTLRAKPRCLSVFLVSTSNDNGVVDRFSKETKRGREKNLEHRRLERPVADGALQNLQFDLDSGGRHPPCRRPAATVFFLLHSSSLCLLLGLVRVLHTCLVYIQED